MGKTKHTKKRNNGNKTSVQGLTELEKLVENSISQAHFVLGQVSTKRDRNCILSSFFFFILILLH